MRRVLLVAAVATIGFGCSRPATPVSSASPEPSPVPKTLLKEGALASVAVAVATVWGSPDAPRPVDAPALENPARINDWLSAMTKEERSDLGPTRVNTSVLYGERVLVLSIKKDWVEVVVPDQASPRDSRGYPGWVPIGQLSHLVPPTDSPIATVTARTTMLQTPEGQPVLEVSYATRLPLISHAGDNLEVWAPDGRTLMLRTKDAAVAAADAPALPRRVSSIISDARRFLGLPYLWDGSSAFGFDCSGITYQVFRTHGILLPRDSFGQATVGREIERSALKRGDLTFFAADGQVHHVGIYLGSDRMLHAPKTGSTVEIADLQTSWYPREYFGARRFIG
jgi:gamma-D-glutamyl-L-lysine dipeptidyl-peptidase